MNHFELYRRRGKMPKGWRRGVPGHCEQVYSKGKRISYYMSPEYQSWRAMIQRCYYPKHDKYPNYGGRGIRVCERWITGNGILSGFECFLWDMGKRPSDMTLNRIQNHLHYTPDNCDWATLSEQIRNRRAPKRKKVA